MHLIPLSIIKKYWFEALHGLQYGALAFSAPGMEPTRFAGREPGPEAQFFIHDWDVLRNIIKRGDIALGEEYIDGRWESDSIENLLTVFLLNLDHFAKFSNGTWASRLVFALYDRVLRRNSRRGSRNNIVAHYDVGNDFYQLWLDESMTYSSALFPQPGVNLREAQRAKYQRILGKFPNAARLLEIGCGWGGFAEEAAAKGHALTGLTISDAQYDFATKRLGGKADIRLTDYRDITGTFDHIVSIEMFEAVGERYWPQYFKVIAERLKTGGKAVIQTITIRDDYFEDYRNCSDFIRHYVFPGGLLPSLQRFREEAAKAGLQCLDVFAFGEDYARTLREWLIRFDARYHEIRAMGYSDAFIRNCRFYLGMCAASFATGRTNVMQVEMSHA